MKTGFVRCLAVFVLMSAQVAADDGDPYLATIAAEWSDAAVAPLPTIIRATLHVANPTGTADTLDRIEGIQVVDRSADSIDIVFGDLATMYGLSAENYLGSSFVIDFDEPSVRDLSTDIGNNFDGTPTIDELTDYVFTHISNKTYSRAFDLASRVATTGAGDCTEHAVLLAALARAQGYPARVIFGALMIDSERRSRVYGHAWVEIHNGSEWQIADATLPEQDPESTEVRYLPLSALDNEGPGYALSLMQSIALMPSKISGIAAAD